MTLELASFSENQKIRIQESFLQKKPVLYLHWNWNFRHATADFHFVFILREWDSSLNSESIFETKKWFRHWIQLWTQSALLSPRGYWAHFKPITATIEISPYPYNPDRRFLKTKESLSAQNAAGDKWVSVRRKNSNFPGRISWKSAVYVNRR